MTTPGDTLENPVTGMTVTIIQTAAENDGRATIIEYTLPACAGSKATAPHRHRRYTERFEILGGRAAYIVGSREMTAGAGETVLIPPDTTHVHPWNIGEEPLLVRQTTEANEPDSVGLTAALAAVEKNFALARAGQVDADGRPTLLQAAVLLDALLPDNYLAGIPLPVQRVVIGGLAAVGRRRGYRAA